MTVMNDEIKCSDADEDDDDNDMYGDWSGGGADDEVEEAKKADCDQ